MRITRFLLGRLGALLGLLLMLSLLLFVLQEISGADPVDATMQRASEEAKAAKRAELGLDDPAIARYVRYVGDLVQLDFGTSFRTKHAVVTDIATYLPQTVELVVVAILLTLALALLFSVSSVLRWPGSSVFRTVLFVGSTAPTFVLGIFGLLLFYQELHWLPGAGSLSDPDAVPDGTGFMFTHAVTHLDPGLAWDVLSHMLMPATALAIGPALAIGRVLRSSIETTLDSDFVRTARAKGLTEWDVLLRHVLRNSANGALSMTGLYMASMFAGVLVIESVFSRTGLGSYLGQSLGASDFPAVAGVTFVLAAIYIVINTVVDILQGVADPRIAV
ncbi:ABC transporter permease [Actinopolymorpha pittospori]